MKLYRIIWRWSYYPTHSTTPPIVTGPFFGDPSPVGEWAIYYTCKAKTNRSELVAEIQTWKNGTWNYYMDTSVYGCPNSAFVSAPSVELETAAEVVMQGRPNTEPEEETVDTVAGDWGWLEWGHVVGAATITTLLIWSLIKK